MAAAALAVVAGLAPGGRAESAEGPALTVVREAHDPDPVPLGAQALREALRPPAEGGLEEAEAALMAVRAAPEVRRAEAGRVRAEEAAARERVSFVPQLDVRASYTRLSRVPRASFSGFGGAGGGEGEGQGDGEGDAPDFFGQQILDRYLVRTSVSVPLSDLFLRILPAYRSAQRRVDVAAWEAEAARQDVALRAREAYYALAGARAAEVVAGMGVAVLRRTERDLAIRVEVGDAAPAEALQARAQLAAVEVQRLSAEGAVAEAAVVLRRLLGLPLDAELALATDLFGPEDAWEPLPPVEALVEAAMAQRPDVRALRSLMAALEQAARAEDGARLPSLSLEGALDWANPNPRFVPQVAAFNRSWEAGVVVAWSPNAALRADHRADELRAERLQVRADLDALENAIATSAARARAQWRTARRALGAARAGVEAAAETLRARRLELQVGTATVTETLEAERALREAQLNLVQAAIDLRVARARLDHVVGRAAPP